MKCNVWNEEKKPLIEILDFIVDNRGKTVPVCDSGIKLIATNCILNSSLFPVYEKVRFVNEEIFNTWFRSHPISGDIIFVNKGTPGKVCLVPQKIDFCIAQDMIALRTNKDVYNKYLFAVLRSKKIQQIISNSTVGSLIPHFKKEQLKDLLIPIPDRKIQEKIGNLYYDLSYKIELNNKKNNKLHDLMKIIFDKWENELTIYKEDSLSSIATFTNGLAMQKLRPIDEIGLPVVKIKEMNSGLSIETERCTSNIKDEVKVFDGDVLFAWSGTLCVSIWCNGLAGLNQHIFKVTSEKYPKWFYYFWTLRHLEEFKRIAKGKATTMGHIQRKELDRAIVKIPDDSEMKKMNLIMEPLLAEYITNNVENRRIEELRDILLPEVMNGKIDLDDLNF